jgi:hypothetical protein
MVNWTRLLLVRCNALLGGTLLDVSHYANEDGEPD